MAKGNRKQEDVRLLHAERMRSIIGANLKAARLRKNLSVWRVHKDAGIPYHHIGRWEKGLRSIDVEWLPALFKVLEIDLDDLFRPIDSERAERAA